MTDHKVMNVREFSKELLYRFNHDEVIGLSAQLAYFFLLSLFPFLLFLITLIGFLPISQDDVLSLVHRYAPGDTIKLIETNLAMILEKKRGGLLSFGVIATIWSASNGVNAIIRAMNRAYDVTESRTFFVSRLMAIFLTFGMIFVIIVALLLQVFGEAIGLFIIKHLEMANTFMIIWDTFRIITSFFVMVSILAVLYFLAPNKRLRFKEVWTGAVVATIGWQLVSFAFSYFVTNFGNYSATYGSLGGIIVLMIWFYLSAMIIILGGELNAILRMNRFPYHK
ncbi:YihY/virulence factor BrkB family protein [Calidifontibacillus oryziterrae]|uniref:YihY/virulence factor BrkB family protein n=1 Tax=Calidifontibacillus oryziterrae TaxID=1191699 RepID=UPI000317B53D|nr:YihY/virulence factor BrkB family protein [Calidifontibacillus oryziterrae]